MTALQELNRDGTPTPAFSRLELKDLPKDKGGSGEIIDAGHLNYFVRVSFTFLTRRSKFRETSLQFRKPFGESCPPPLSSRNAQYFCELSDEFLLLSPPLDQRYVTHDLSRLLLPSQTDIGRLGFLCHLPGVASSLSSLPKAHTLTHPSASKAHREFQKSLRCLLRLGNEEEGSRNG